MNVTSSSPTTSQPVLDSITQKKKKKKHASATWSHALFLWTVFVKSSWEGNNDEDEIVHDRDFIGYLYICRCIEDRLVLVAVGGINDEIRRKRDASNWQHDANDMP